MPSSRPPFSNAKMVQSFRGEMRAPPPLHSRERALVVLASLHLCFLPWALGARAPWTQIVSLVLGACAFALALLPRRYEGELAPQGAFVLHPWPRLLRFPVFWLGLLFLGYVTCQALNPAYLRATAGPYWWIAPIEHVEWLPSGVDAPFALMNTWRMLVFWGGAWALGCALWIGLTRRAAVQALVTVLVANGALLALIGVLQKVTDAKEVLWFIKPVAPTFVATFFYENYGGAYFNLILVCALALTAWHHTRALRRLERSSPAPVFAFLALVVANIVLMSGSRASLVLLVGFLIAGAALYLLWRLRMKEAGAHPVVTGVVVVGAAALIATAAWFLNWEKGFDALRKLAESGDKDSSYQVRVLARQATLDLFQAEPATGWGAGSFRHAFPIAQQHYPAIHKTHGGRSAVWEDAHNDYVQALAELGVVGFAFPLAALLWLLFRFCRAGGLGQPAFALLALGLTLPFAHAWIDSPLYNCAIFTTLCAALVLLVRWAELETQR